MIIKGNAIITGTTEGITFTDGSNSFPRQPKLNVSPTDFYLSVAGDGRPVLNLRTPASALTGISINDGVSSYSSQSRLGFSSHFYLSKDTQGGIVVNDRNPLNKSIVLEFPGAAENILIFRAHEAMRIVSGRAVMIGAASPSVTLLIQSGTNRSSLSTTNISSTTVTSTSSGDSLTVSNPLIAAGSWVVLETTAQSGTVFELDVSLQVEWV